MKADALAFSWAGDEYLGRSYQEMDCQAFVEKCMEKVGIRMDLAGSNTWYREINRNGWTGTPEECVKIFGSVPKGALLFILEQNGKEPEKYRKDGIGNASHIGIKTGRGKGAIHSSGSRGCVAESEFHDKTIRNGGWNRVGLWNRMDYGKTVNWLLEHIGIGQEPVNEQKEEDKKMTVTVYSENGKPVNLRKSADKSAALLDVVPVGTDVEIIGSAYDRNGKAWSKIKVDGKTGWMMTEFLATDESAEPVDGADTGDSERGQSERVALYFTADELSAILPVMESAVDQIVQKVGRG